VSEIFLLIIIQITNPYSSYDW